MSMDFYFNELSLTPYSRDESEVFERLNKFAQLVSKFKEKSFDFTIRSNDTIATMMVFEGVSVMDFVKQHGRSALFDFLRQCFKRPYIPDDKLPEGLFRKYHNSFFELVSNGTRVRCVGLGCAVLAQTIAIGFYSESFWNTIKFSLIKTTEELTEESHDAICLSHIDHVAHPDFIEWQDMRSSTNPPICTIPPEDKEVPSFGDHHGNHILRDFAARIVNNRYVCSIISSDRYHPGFASFVKTIYPDGKILLVLHWFSTGYSILIQTTGTNYHQTKYIAERITEEYDRNA